MMNENNRKRQEAEDQKVALDATLTAQQAQVKWAVSAIFNRVERLGDVLHSQDQQTRAISGQVMRCHESEHAQKMYEAMLIAMDVYTAGLAASKAGKLERKQDDGLKPKGETDEEGDDGVVARPVRTLLVAPRSHTHFDQDAPYSVRMAKTRTRVRSAHDTFETRSDDDHVVKHSRSEVAMAQLLWLIRKGVIDFVNDTPGVKDEMKLEPGVPVCISAYIRNSGYAVCEFMGRLTILAAYGEISGITELVGKDGTSYTCKLSREIANWTEEDIIDVMMAMSLPVQPFKDEKGILREMPTVLEQTFPPTMWWNYAKTKGLKAKQDPKKPKSDAVLTKQWRAFSIHDAVEAAKLSLDLMRVVPRVAIRRVRRERQAIIEAAAKAAAKVKATPKP